VADGRAVNMGGYGEGQTVRFNKTPGMAESSALAQRGRENPSVRAKYDNPELIARRNAFSAEKKERHQAFKDANGGLSYKQMDRLENSRRAIERNVKAGRISRSEANERMEGLASRAMSRGDGSGIQRQPGDQTLNNPPQRNRLTRVEPEQAKQNVQVLTEQSPVIKNFGWTPTTNPTAVMQTVSGLQLNQMTSEQRFEAARSVHDYMLSQLESGNADWQTEAGLIGEGDDPRIALLGLDQIKPGNKDQMLKWFEDLQRQARAITKWSPDQNPGYGLGSF